MNDMQVIVVTRDGTSAGRIVDLLTMVPGIHVEALVRTHPSLVVVTEISNERGSEWGERLETLSPRQQEVLQELVDGKAIGPASDELFMSTNTFRTHVKNILAKLDAHSSLEAASIAVSGGMRPRRDNDGDEPSRSGPGAQKIGEKEQNTPTGWF
jgi:DNA-binding CsgD family transcriptional regulator